MKIDLLFGQNGLTIDLPGDLHIEVVRKHAMPLLQDPAGAVRRALDTPVGSRPLAEVAAGAGSACILICDVTRPVPNGTLLPPLIRTLVNAGIKEENILVLVATGLHRPNEGEELREIVGSDAVMNAVRVENHFARDRGAHRDLGETSGGIPIGIDRRFLDADVRIVTGLVEPHFMAGYSGGRKVVAPGIAYQDTVLKFHTAHILEHPKAANCVLKGNPLHQAQLEIVRAIGGVLALNVIIDEWQTEMLVKALKKGTIQLYCTGLSPEDLKDIYVQAVPSVEAAVTASVDACGDKAVAVVPEGPYVIPLGN